MTKSIEIDNHKKLSSRFLSIFDISRKKSKSIDLDRFSSIIELIDLFRPPEKQNDSIRVRFLKKIQDWILKSANGFCICFLNRFIQDLSDHDQSKEQKNPLPERIHWFLCCTMIGEILN